jgi:hypothetical protein
MKRTKVLISLFVISLMFLGCGATTKSSISFSEENYLGDNDAIIYVYRLPNIVGSAAAWKVRLDGKIVATLRQNAYLVLHVTPGEHELKVGDPGLMPASLGTIKGSNTPVATKYSVVDQANFFTAKAKEIYCFRSNGFEEGFLPQKKAWEELKLMKYDPGQ